MDLLFTDHYLIATVPHIAAGPADSQQRISGGQGFALRSGHIPYNVTFIEIGMK